jgi:hypothetical protein
MVFKVSSDEFAYAFAVLLVVALTNTNRDSGPGRVLGTGHLQEHYCGRQNSNVQFDQNGQASRRTMLGDVERWGGN